MFIIRPSRLDDFVEIMHLLRQLWPSQPQEESHLRDVYMRSIDSDRDILLSAEINNKVVGFGAAVIKNSFWQEAYIGYITTLIVEEELRNQGMGRKLLDKFTRLLKSHGCKKIELDSGFHREQAHSMYEHYGFKKRAFLFSKDL